MTEQTNPAEIIAEAIRSVDVDSMTDKDTAAILATGDMADEEARCVIGRLAAYGFTIHAETEGVSAPEPLRIWVSEKPLYMPPVETGLRRVGRILTEFGFGVALIAGAVWIVLEMLR